VEEGLYGIREAAKLLSYSERQVRQMCIDGKIPGACRLPKGRKWLIPGSALRAVGKGEESKARADVQSEEEAHGKPKEIDPLLVDRKRKHQQDMLTLVKIWRDELGVSLWRHPIRDLGKPGVHSDRQGLVWQVAKDDTVRLLHPVEVDRDMDTAFLRDYFHQHLRSSRQYSWMLDDKENGICRWEVLAGLELGMRAQLLEKIDSAIKEKSALSPAEGLEPHSIAFVSNAVCCALVDMAPDSDRIARLRDLLSQIRVWPDMAAAWSLPTWSIGNVPILALYTPMDGERGQRVFAHMMSAFEKHSLTQGILGAQNEREAVARAMQEALTKMAGGGHVPGVCSGCPS